MSAYFNTSLSRYSINEVTFIILIPRVLSPFRGGGGGGGGGGDCVPQ